MSPIFTILCLLLGIFAGVPGAYYFYMRRYSSRPWNLKNDPRYFPFISVVVPMHNEEKIIRLKLENLMNIEYPKEKLQTIVVNDGSNDASMPTVLDFQKSNSKTEIEILDNTGCRGKVASLNLALKHAKGEIIVVSDADCFWPRDVLSKALQFLSDASIGAVTGLEKLLNPKETWVTETEILYNDTVHTIRIGESKFHSTIIFQGGFGAYKRSVLDHFDREGDDSGTALNTVQKGLRTLLVPEVTYFTISPRTLKGKTSIKLRRAINLERIWLRCLNLFARGEIVLPKRIFLPEAYLHIFNPIIFLLLIPTSLFVLLENPLLSILLLGLLAAALLVRKLRTLTIETVQNQFFLLGAIFSLAFKRKIGLWATEENSREYLKREMLEAKGLV